MVANAVSRSMPGSGRRIGFRWAACAALASLAGATFAAAPDRAPSTAASDPGTLVAAADVPRPSVQVNGATLPRFDTIDGNTRTSRVDLSVLPSSGSGVGLSMGIDNASGASPGFSPIAAPSQSMDLGVKWRYASGGRSFDVTAYRRMPAANDAITLVQNQDPAYGARVEMGLGARTLHKGFVANRGFVGFQLESGARITMRRKNGGPMLYYRNDF